MHILIYSVESPIIPESRPVSIGDTSAASSIELSSVRFSPLSENMFSDDGKESQFCCTSPSQVNKKMFM